MTPQELKSPEESSLDYIMQDTIADCELCGDVS